MPDTTPTPADNLRAQLGAALRRWGLLDEVNDPAATEAFVVTDLMAVLREPLARKLLGTPTTDPAPAACPCAVGVASAQCSPRGCAPAPECRECNDTGACNGGPCPLTASAPAAPADRATDRRDRYAAAMALRDGHPAWPVQYEDDERDYLRRADAVMAVADTEQAALRAEAEGLDEALRGLISASDKDCARLRAEVNRLRAARAAVLRELEARYRTHARDSVHPTLGAAYAAVANDLRRLADEAQPTETDDGDPICGDQYDGEACELEPEHAGAHCAGIVCWDYGRAPATAATEEPEHGHVWVTALDGDNRPIHDEHGRPVTHCGICGQRPAIAATEEPQP